MKKSIFLFFFLLSFSLFAQNKGILIKNATVISANEQKISSQKAFVLIENDKIVYVGKKKPKISGKYQEIEAEGKYVMSGLIDSHVHSGQMIGFARKHFKKYPEMVEKYLAQEPRNYLYFGFTDLVDLGEWNEATEKRYRESDFAPNLYGVGQTIRHFDGYGHNFYEKPDGYTEMPNWVFNPEQKKDIPQSIDLEQHTPKTTVQNAVKLGAVAVKTFYEDGFSGAIHGLQLPSDSLLAEIVKEAHSHKLPVILHATSVEGYKKAVFSEADILAHGLWHFEKGNFLESTPPARLEIEKIVENIAQKGIFVQPTMRVVLSEKDIFTWNLLQNPDLRHVLPPDLFAWFGSEEGKWGQQNIQEEYENFKPDKNIPNLIYIDSLVNRVEKMANLMQKKGVKFIFGTDSPTNWYGLGGVAGLNGFLEIQALAKAGLTLEEIFSALTYRNAIAFRLENKIGSIAAGKQANVLILNENPLKTIAAYNQIETVIIRGKAVKRSELSAVNY